MYNTLQEKSFLLPILLTITTPPGWGVVFFFFFLGLGVVGSSSGSSCSSDSSSRFWMQCPAFSKWPISLTEMQIESYSQWEHHQYNKMKGFYRLLYQYQDWWPTWPLTRWREPRRSKPRRSIPDENENWFINYQKEMIINWFFLYLKMHDEISDCVDCLTTRTICKSFRNRTAFL